MHQQINVRMLEYLGIDERTHHRPYRQLLKQSGQSGSRHVQGAYWHAGIKES